MQPPKNPPESTSGENRDLRSKSELIAGLDAMQRDLQEVEKWACCSEPSQRVRLEYRVRELETTIKTFLHDLDDQDGDESLPRVLMTNGMWLQVSAFRKLVGSI